MNDGLMMMIPRKNGLWIPEWLIYLASGSAMQCNAMRFDIISRSATVIDALVVVLFVPSCAVVDCGGPSPRVDTACTYT